MTNAGAEALMQAIVNRACLDWKSAVRRLEESRYDNDAAYLKRDCEKFFRSQYCFDMTGISGDDLLSRLRRQCDM